jgi:hypothetical protein
MTTMVKRTRPVPVLHDHIDEGPRFRFGTSRHGSISLDIEQATKLANELIQSINEYNRIDSDYATSVSFDFENAARVCVKSSEAGKELRKLYVDNKK